VWLMTAVTAIYSNICFTQQSRNKCKQTVEWALCDRRRSLSSLPMMLMHWLLLS
jgi:hypothetical protein